MRKLSFFLILTLVSSFIPSITTNVFADGNVTGLWHMDEGDGNVIYDSTTNQNNGTINGAAWTSGKSGSAISCDGVDDFACIPNTPTLIQADGVTLEGWVKFYSLKTDWFPRRNTILEKRELDANNNMIGGFYLDYSGWDYNKGAGSFEFDLSTTSGIFSQGVTYHILMDTWYYVVFTYDGTNVKLYVNGALLNTWPFSGAIQPGQAPLDIGKPHHYLDSYSNAVFDEFKVRDYAITAEEIEQIYKGDLPTPELSPTPASTLDPSATPTNTPLYYKISGYTSPAMTSGINFKEGFEVKVEGTSLSALTDADGYFQITNVPVNTVGYTIKISKPNYLSRSVANVAVNSDIQISSQSSAVELWAGDIDQDNVIGMSDIMKISESFNSKAGDISYDLNADLNCDRTVNMTDIMILTKNFSKTSADYPGLVFAAT